MTDQITLIEGDFQADPERSERCRNYTPNRAGICLDYDGEKCRLCGGTGWVEKVKLAGQSIGRQEDEKDKDRCPECGVKGWIDHFLSGVRHCRACKAWIDAPQPPLEGT